MKPVYYDFLSTSLGGMLLASDGDALAGEWFERQRYEPSVGPSWKRERRLPILVWAGTEIGEYLAGTRRAFTVPLCPAGTAFQRDVWSAIAAIPYGETAAYQFVFGEWKLESEEAERLVQTPRDLVQYFFGMIMKLSIRLLGLLSLDSAADGLC